MHRIKFKSIKGAECYLKALSVVLFYAIFNIKEAIRLNRIYKVIFNRAKGQHQVVSELAKNGGKTSGNSLLRTIIKSGGGTD